MTLSNYKWNQMHPISSFSFLFGKTLSEYCRQSRQEGFSEESITRSVSFPAFGCLICSLEFNVEFMMKLTVLHSSLANILRVKGEHTKLGSSGWSGYTNKVQLKKDLPIVSRSVP